MGNPLDAGGSLSAGIVDGGQGLPEMPEMACSPSYGLLAEAMSRELTAEAGKQTTSGSASRQTPAEMASPSCEPRSKAQQQAGGLGSHLSPPVSLPGPEAPQVRHTVPL